MCMVCDGYSPEEIELHNDMVIRVYGYLMLQIEDDPPWTYTIGAFESWDQPELLVVDIDGETQALLVKAVADDYVVFGEVRQTTLEMLDLELVPVHEAHLRGDLVAAWENRYSISAGAGDFLQILPGSSWFCEHCAQTVRRLDEPETRPRTRANRAHRRARSKRRGGRK